MGVLAISFLVAVLVSTRLERLICGPIQALADTARRITSRGDYALRAVRAANDEVGEFTNSFNQMLDQIQQGDAALRHEIAERGRAEQELQRVHRQLIDASRAAGMAEVATGVLHNVGNVLNSVNVSAILIAEKLGSSRTGNLLRATELLRGQNGQLGNFLTDDPKGRLLPGYLAELSEHLSLENAEARTELESLMKNIEHIKDIVAMQQSYARMSGFIESLPVEDLVEDALRINAGAFLRHRVTLLRDYEPVPVVAIDKHKVLQILVNLLRNAKYAMDDTEDSDRQLTVRIRQRGDDDAAVVIEVADTGIGIPAENLTRIFSHGFTTRHDGHGFGLHSAALAAQQMGGRLYCSSPGPGQGAVFTLELPIAAPSAAIRDSISEPSGLATTSAA
jgi:signal transduction histidine kinase